MKRYYILFTLSLIFSIGSNAQNPENKNGLIFRTLWSDFVNPNGGNLSDYKNYRYGFSAAYARNLSKVFNIEAPIKVINTRTVEDSRNKFMAGIDLQLHAQYYKDADQVLIPYLLLGVGANYIDTPGINIEFPVGLGLDIRLFDRGYLNFQGEYRFSSTENRKNVLLGVGIKYLLGKSNKYPDMDHDGVVDSLDRCPTIKGLISLQGCPDKDNDGVADDLDLCPDVPGTISTNGCPDKDGDGVRDNIDACPTEAGPASNNGCPIKDRDGDGIDDIVDKCPDIFGVKSANGCPDRDEDGVPDSEDECPDEVGVKAFNGCPDIDGDGVEDREDKCPKTYGTKANKGCPEIEKKDQERLDFAMQAVQFELGKTTLLPRSFDILDEIATIMKKYPDYNLEISGHTDPSGKRETNMKLSTNRAKACYNYLVSKGISTGRLSYMGYGPDRPRYDNTTEQGRILNRRVEFRMYVK